MIEMEKGKVQIFTLMFFALGLAGCAALGRVDLLKANVGETEWKVAPPNGYRYTFQYNGIRIYTCRADAGGRLLSIGPPLIPFIPVPDLSKSYPNFDFEFGIESPSSDVTIDFSKVALKLPDGTRLVPIDVVTWAGVFPNACATHWSDLRGIAAERFVISGTARYFGMKFSIRRTKVEECVIELGTIIVNGENISLPPLKLKKDSVYPYRPFMLPLPS